MAYEIQLPRLGWDMVEGSLAAWLKQDGEYVSAGEMLFSVEGDKAVQEIEAFESGFLRILPDGPQIGQKVPVGALLGYLVPKEELESFKFPGSGVGPQTVNLDEPPGSVEPVGQMAPPEIPQIPQGRPRRIYISPFAKRLAQGLGVEWQKVKGSGLGGRIMAHDIQEAAALMKAVLTAAPVAALIASPAAPLTITAPPLPAPASTRVPMTHIRKRIAEHMAQSAHTTAPVTLTTEVDATELVALRNALKNDPVAQEQLIPSYNDLFTKIVAQALLEHPVANARLEGDEIVQLASVHVAMAVDTERGLIVPVIRDVQAKTLRQIAFESAALIEKTRSGAITYEDLQGATFTITNLGMFDIDAFTPIIDLPQCAILGVGRIMPKQVVVDVAKERVAIRQMVALSLTFDHRLMDGAQAARLLQRVKQFVETPCLWMVG